MGEAASGGEKVRLGIAACLLGEKVRYDGGHKYDPFLVETLGEFVEWVGVCPEVECGLPVPREAMRLVGEAENPRLVTTRTAVDHTERMKSWAERRARELESEGLCGYVFKAKSPSSGMERVKVYGADGVAKKVGMGMWARAFMEHFPLLPVEEEGRLHDPAIRENFIERVFCLKRYRDMVAEGRTRGALVGFQSREKMLMMSHSVEGMRELGRLVARPKELRPTELFAAYERVMLRVLAMRATPRKHANVLQHMMGWVKKMLSSDEKQEMLDLIERMKTGMVPLVVPVTLMQHYVRKYGVEYLAEQSYLNPHPVELKLRNHA